LTSPGDNPSPRPVDVAQAPEASERQSSGSDPTIAASAMSDLMEERDSALSIGSPAYESLGRTLSGFAPIATISAIAGLLTVPAYQVASIRLEMLLHLAVAYCNGKRVPKRTHLSNWVNDVLAELPARRMEDPPEDVFVSNVIASSGNYRIFEGTWDLSDAYLQDVLTCIEQGKWAQRHVRLRRRVFALLRLSEALVSRTGIERWAATPLTTPTDQVLKPSPELGPLGRRVRFSEADLGKLGIALQDLTEFLLIQADRPRLLEEELTHTTLARHPLILFESDIIVAYPSALSCAIRQFVLDWAHDNEETENLGKDLRYIQRRQVFGNSLRSVSKGRLRSPPLIPEVLPSPPAPIQIDYTVIPFDEDKLVHVVLLHDDLDSIRGEGVGSTARLSPETGVAFAQYLSETAFALSRNTVAGMTLLVSGGMGRGAALQFAPFPPNWYVIPISVHDFAMFANSNEASLLRIWKLERVRTELEDHGISILDMNGLVNIYEYWRRLDFHLVPASVPYPQQHGMIAIGTNYIHDFRINERRSHDIHAAPFDDNGHALAVRRVHRDSFFASLKDRPIFVADGMLEEGMLLGVVEHPRIALWIWASRSGLVPEAVSFLYRIWDATLSWIDRLLPTLLKGSGASYAPIHLRLEMDQLQWNKLDARIVDPPARPTAEINSEQRQVTVTLPSGFRSLLHRAANDGERALMEEIADAILNLIHSGRNHRARAESLVTNAMGGTEARSLHVFDATRPTDYFLKDDPDPPRLIAKENVASWELGLAWRGRERDGLRALSVESKPSDDARDSERDFEERPIVITGRDNCTAILNDTVNGIWQTLRPWLAEVNGQSLIPALLENIESIIQDRLQWHRTARAVTGLYSSSEDVESIAAERESLRAQAGAASRVLVEMALSTCPLTAGRPAALTDIDALIAGVYTLINLAADSDAIHGELAELRLDILPSGVIQRRYGDLLEIVNSFGIESHIAQYREGAASYDSLFKPSHREETAKGNPDWLADPTFVNAYIEEYGIAPTRLMNGIGELLDIAHESHSVVARVTRSQIAASLVDRRGFTDSEVTAFLATLSLVPRERWDSTPNAYKARDWQPWRFRRRLSLVARPLVSFGMDDNSVVMYGVNQLSASLSYAIESIRSAWLPDEYFRTAAMKRYRGSVVDAAGHAFNSEVGEALTELGWEVRTEVQMSSFGADRRLGDLDVIGWRAGEARLLLIECKRLQPTRTVGEIVDQLNRFRGETGDSLDKHLQRIDWVTQNIERVRESIGAPSSAAEASPYLVTSAEVPLSFASHLALAPNRIVSGGRLAEVFGRDKRSTRNSKGRR
jgi:hypothetical protein